MTGQTTDIVNDRKNQPASPGIYSQSRGEGNKTIIFAHGLPSSLYEWGPMSQTLVANGYRTIALDLPGHGDSLKPAEIDFYSADTFYSYFRGWIENLNLPSPPVLLGHSFGGYLSLRYALEHQPDLRGLILINPFLAHQHLTAVNRFFLSAPFISSRVLRNTPFGLIEFSVWAGSLISRNFHIYSFLSKSERRQVARDFKRCSPNIAYLPETVADITPKVADLKIPTLLIWGSRDRTLSPSWYARIASKIPNSTAKVLTAGHNPHLSNFDEVVPIVLEFLESTFSQKNKPVVNNN